ncbi:hypothetical protein RMCBS344292_08044 [Rhizopus microsporus]|nr:hypothetical protein RMCBS344292_08044 [Rhizopus microsporus]
MGKRKGGTVFTSSVPGMEFDLEGPTVDHLFDISAIQNKIVYQDIHAQLEEWEVLEKSDAVPYLPARTEPVNVKVGIEEKTSVRLDLFGSIRLANHFKYKKGYLLNTGGNTWGLDFVPKVESRDTSPFIQYLAVAGYRGASEERIGLNEEQPTGTYKNCVQLWKLKLSVKQEPEEPLLDVCILHDFGAVYDLKWCPYGVYEEVPEDTGNGLPKLGILAMACGDGTIRTLVVPHPDALRTSLNLNHNTVYLRVKSSRCTFAATNSKPLTIQWGGHKKLASGGTGNDVSIWNMESALTQPTTRYGQHLIFSYVVLDSPSKCITWRGQEDPYHIIVCGFDGQIQVIDIRDPCIPFTFMRSRGPVYAASWVGHAPMLLVAGSEDSVRGMTYYPGLTPCLTKYGNLPGPCWHLGTSEHHGQFLTATATGWLASANMYQYKGRVASLYHYYIYKLCYSEETNTYVYIDGIGFKSQEEIAKTPQYELFTVGEVSLQRAVWNPNRRTAGFIASAGSAGLCRIEFEGRGSKWE